MPKRWVREARRQARAAAVPTTSSSPGLPSRCPLPVLHLDQAPRALPADGWPPFTTWCRAACERLLDGRDDGGQLDAAVQGPVGASVLALLRCAFVDGGWVVRGVRGVILLRRPSCSSVVVTTRITGVGAKGLDTEHEIRVRVGDTHTAEGEEDEEEFGDDDVMAVISLTIGLVKDDDVIHPDIVRRLQTLVCSPSAVDMVPPASLDASPQLPPPFSIPTPLVATHTTHTYSHSTRLRFSDCTNGVLNRDKIMDLVLDALLSNKQHPFPWHKTHFFALNVPTDLSAFTPGADFTLDTTRWMGDGDAMCWSATTSPPSSSSLMGISCFMTTKRD